jgi:hypothetical protein
MNKTFIYLAIAVLALGVIVLGMYLAMAKNSRQTTQNNQTTTPSEANSVAWMFNGSTWQANNSPPACPDPLTLNSPVDLTKATALLYPGQTRGGDYKAHGGFVFKNSQNDDITVAIPMDAEVVRGSRYNETGEVQYLFEFVAPCGIMYRFDHLRTLSEPFQKIAETFPTPSESSQTQNINPSVSVKEGDIIATSVGFIKNSNTTVDWGVYDLRTKNEAAKNAAWAAEHNTEFAPYGVCWLDWLSSSNMALVKGLPGGDGQSGKMSDYCK